MDIKLKKRIIGFLLLLGVILIAVPLFFGHSIPMDELKLSGYVPAAPPKPADIALPLPLKTAATPGFEPALTSQTNKLSTTTGLMVDKLPASASAVSSQTVTPNNGNKHATEISLPLLASSPVANPANVETPTLITGSMQPDQPSIAVNANAFLTAQDQPSVPAESSTKAPATIPVNTTKTLAKGARSTTRATVSTPQKSSAKKAVTTFPEAAEAWIVQLGSFSTKGNAEKLMRKLHTQGFAAYLRATKTAQGNFVRVLVGPNLRRSDAEQVQKRIEKTFNISGVITRSGVW